MTIDSLRKMLMAACQNEVYAEDYLYEFEPHVTAKLLQDRDELVLFLERVISHPKFRNDHPLVLEAQSVLDSVNSGWPQEEER